MRSLIELPGLNVSIFARPVAPITPVGDAVDPHERRVADRVENRVAGLLSHIGILTHTYTIQVRGQRSKVRSKSELTGADRSGRGQGSPYQPCT